MIDPALDRDEPVVWVRWIAVVPSAAPGVAPIREVSFRLGLNIIRTADRPPGEVRVIRHSVGKTLLTRLLRYCLGETHFAVDAVRKRIAARLPEGHVIADVRISGRPWIVVRPMRDAPASASWAAPTADWRLALARFEGIVAFQDFHRLLEQATINPVPAIPLANSGRGIRWLDLLGWLARDHECHYRVYNEWREPDAESGTGKLNRDDSSFLMRLIMGLVNTDERAPLEGHCRLLSDQETTRDEIARQSRSINESFPLLRTRLGLSEEECNLDRQLVGGLFVTRAKEVVIEKVRSLKRLSAEIRTGARTAELYQAAVKKAQALAVATNELERTMGLQRETHAELRQREQSSSADYYRLFSPARNCPADDCPLKPATRPIQNVPRELPN